MYLKPFNKGSFSRCDHITRKVASIRYKPDKPETVKKKCEKLLSLSFELNDTAITMLLGLHKRTGLA